MKKRTLSLDSIDAFIFDFDGVLTDNTVSISEDGKEYVNCSRGDGIAFDALRKLEIPTYIISSEINNVVVKRAAKLKIDVLNGVKNKAETLLNLLAENGFRADRVFYVGNDLNDYYAMQSCGYTACPSDSHPKIRDIASFVLQAKGGQGVVRELLEELLYVDILQILYTGEKS